MICKNCGHNIRENSRFCSNCGVQFAKDYTEIHNNSDIPYTFQQSEIYDNPDICPENERKKGGYATPIILYALCIVFIVLFATGGYEIFWFIGAIALALTATFAPIQRNYCPNCYYRKAPNAKSCPHCGHIDMTAIPIWLSIIILIGLIIFFFVSLTFPFK